MSNFKQTFIEYLLSEVTLSDVNLFKRDIINNFIKVSNNTNNFWKLFFDNGGITLEFSQKFCVIFDLENVFDNKGDVVPGQTRFGKILTIKIYIRNIMKKLSKETMTVISMSNDTELKLLFNNLLNSNVLDDILEHECIHVKDYLEKEGNAERYVDEELKKGYINMLEMKAYIGQIVNVLLRKDERWNSFNSFYEDFLKTIPNKEIECVLLQKGEVFLKKVLYNLYSSDFKGNLLENVEESSEDFGFPVIKVHEFTDCTWVNDFFKKLKK